MYTKPHTYSQKELKLLEVMQAESAQALITAKISELITGLMYKNRASQIKWLEDHTETPLRPEPELWSKCVEAEQRRHLFVHCDGRVNQEYLDTCRSNGVQLPSEVVKDATLGIPPDYFEECCTSIFAAGIQLLQKVWRRIGKVTDDADKSFINVGYYRILAEDYRLAVRLLNWAVTERQIVFSSRDCEVRCVLNLAQAYKWSGEGDGCAQTLQAYDWSDSQPFYQLARCCLLDDFEGALKRMEEVGQTRPDVSSEYRDWPIFKEIRKRQDFISAFERIFGHALDSEGHVLNNRLELSDG